MNLGFAELAVIMFLAVLIFGPSKLPQLGKAAGQTLKEFKSGMKGVLDEDTPKKEKAEN